MHQLFEAASSQQPAASSQQPAASRSLVLTRSIKRLSIGLATCLNMAAVLLTLPAPAQAQNVPVTVARDLPRAGPIEKLQRERAPHTKNPSSDAIASTFSALCVDQGDPGCGGDLELIGQWTLNFRFPTEPDIRVDLEKVITIAQRATCYIWRGNKQIVLPTCSLSDVVYIPEIAALTQREFQALDAEVQMLAKVIQKCVKASGRFSTDLGGVEASIAAKRDLQGIQLSPRNDLVVVRYSGGEVVTYAFDVFLGGGYPNLINPRPATADERQVCVVAA